MSNRKTGRPVGRPPGAVSKNRQRAADIIAALEKSLGHSCHPLEALLRIGHDTTQPMELRAACFRDCLPYCLPRMQTQTVALTGPDGEGPVRVQQATLDVGKLLADPIMAQAYQNLALAVVEMEADAEGAGNSLPREYSYEMLPSAQPTKP